MKRTHLDITLIIFLAAILLISGCVSQGPIKSEPDLAPPKISTLDIPTEMHTVPVTVPTLQDIPNLVLPYKDSDREMCGENLCPSGWECCTNLKICYQGQKPLNCDSSENAAAKFFPSQSGEVINAIKQSSSTKPDSYPVCVKMPDGSMNCPDYSGNYKAVPTASALSKAIGL